MLRQILTTIVGVVIIACNSSAPIVKADSSQPSTKSDSEKNRSNTSKKEAFITSEEVEKMVTYLASDELNGRDTGSEGIEKAATYIENYFKDNNVKPYFETYRDHFKVNELDAFNVVGMLPGNDVALKHEFVVIGAHYDHIGKGKEVNGDEIANGANDNAAGTAVVMALAKYFAHHKNNKRSIIFALFSAEERGLLGSKHLANKLKTEGLQLYTMLNFEMIGVPLQGKSYTAYITGYEKSNLAEKINEYASATLAGFLPQAKKYQLFFRSDNYPFYQAFNVPSQTFSTFDFTNFDYYHHVDDEADELDYQHMTNFINAFIPGVRGIANSEKGSIQLK